MSDRKPVINRVIVEAYGRSPMAAALAQTLDEEWDSLVERGTRQRGITDSVGRRIWDFFSGGDTAYNTAGKIVAALSPDARVGEDDE